MATFQALDVMQNLQSSSNDETIYINLDAIEIVEIEQTDPSNILRIYFTGGYQRYFFGTPAQLRTALGL